MCVQFRSRLLHLCRWYHGKISRQTASVRLEAHKQPGAFLVRESGSEPGNLVLSFLDREERVFHYMINYKDGQYNTAGQTSNWFSTLEELIGYYTKYSTVKKNQHLDKPVPPPEVSCCVATISRYIISACFSLLLV